MTENRVAAIVFFDVDHTLIPRTSTEWQLLLGLLRRGAVPFDALVRSGWRFIRHPSELTGERLRRNKSYFTGIREEVFVRNATQIFQTRIAGRISSQGRDEIARLKAGGQRVVLLSAGPTILTRLVQTAVKADDTLGADFEVVRGRLTGRLTNRLRPTAFEDGRDPDRDQRERSRPTRGCGARLASASVPALTRTAEFCMMVPQTVIFFALSCTG